ncbi:NUDIX hydrolase [Streptobacillus felis]|uniref:NUDIX hydrolase n=1 Tax=Streptobacillus felis TaxID=1384509 RepID=UPI00082E78BD|nr:NUDIX hydrolase [Streptobacillus felis]
MEMPIKDGFKFLKGAIKYHPTTKVPLEYIIKDDAVCLTVFDENLDKVLLVEQYRPGVDKAIFENVAGIIDPGESPFVAVNRELKEETGYSPEDVVDFVSMKNPMLVDPYMTQYIYFYAARLKSNDIIPGETDFDEAEDIKSHWINIDEIENYLIDMKTLLSIKYFLPILEEMRVKNEK